jgi:hypothetical protein
MKVLDYRAGLIEYLEVNVTADVAMRSREISASHSELPKGIS